jgi:hypothetical protein
MSKVFITLVPEGFPGEPNLPLQEEAQSRWYNQRLMPTTAEAAQTAQPSTTTSNQTLPVDGHKQPDPVHPYHAP